MPNISLADEINLFKENRSRLYGFTKIYVYALMYCYFCDELAKD